MIVSHLLSAQYTYEWNDYYGGDAKDELSSLVKTYDGNVVMAGISKDSVDAMWLVEVTPTGIKQWSKLYSGYPLLHPVKIVETHDKNILVTGIVAEGDSVPHKIWLIKIDREGRILWEKLYSGKGDAYVTDIVETFDRGLVVAGYTAPNTDDFPDWYIMKLDSLGNFVWDRSFGSPYDDRALSVDQMFDSTLIVVGYISYSYGGNKKASLSKFTPSGQDIWYNDLKLGDWSSATSVVATSDSAFVVSVEIKKEELINFDIKIMKMTTNGDTIWTQSLKKPLWTQPVSIIETFDEGYALAYTSKSDGVFNTNVAVLKLNPFGHIAWEKVFKRKSDDYAAQIIEGEDNGLMVAASTYTVDKAWNFGLLKFKSLERSDLRFVTPKQQISTVYDQNIPIDAYIKGYKKPIEIKIYINRNLVTTVKKFKVLNDTVWDYSLQYNLKLTNGLNIVDFVVTDYKEFKFIKTRKIYYLPGATPHW